MEIFKNNTHIAEIKWESLPACLFLVEFICSLPPDATPLFTAGMPRVSSVLCLTHLYTFGLVSQQPCLFGFDQL